MNACTVFEHILSPTHHIGCVEALLTSSAAVFRYSVDHGCIFDVVECSRKSGQRSYSQDVVCGNGSVGDAQLTVGNLGCGESNSGKQ